MQFEQEVVLITGASRGLGAAFAQCIAAAGATVIVNSTGADGRAEDVCREIAAQGGKAIAVPGRVEQADALIEQIIERTGRLDAVVHNAGFVQDKTLRKMSDEQWSAVMGVHLDAAFRLSRAAWPHFEAGNGGRLVFISSAAGLYGNFGQANYAAAKMGLYGLCRTIALEGAASNICCNTVAPFGATEMNSGHMDEERRESLQPAFVAPLIGYLAHPACHATGGLFEASAGGFRQVRWERSNGLTLDTSAPLGIDQIADGWDELTDFSTSDHPQDMREALYNTRND